MDTSSIPRLQQLQQLASDFVASQSNRTSLITVTRAEFSNSNSVVTFYVSIFPEDKEGPAVGFLMRKRGECKEYIKKHSSMKYVPHVEFVLDDGEKSRRRVDELLSE
jgi:ribosome-binding factor A